MTTAYIAIGLFMAFLGGTLIKSWLDVSRERRHRRVRLGHYQQTRRNWDERDAEHKTGTQTVSDYLGYLQSPEWKAKIAEYRASDRPQACACGRRDVQFHHLTYRNLGNEPLEDLVALCPDHHKALHNYLRLMRLPTIRRTSLEYIETLRLAQVANTDGRDHSATA